MDVGAIWSSFLGSPSTQLALRVIGVYLLGLYAVTVFWTMRDARQRVANPVTPYILGSLALIPFLGVLLYVIVRPRENRAEAYERELARRALLADAERRQTCPTCALRVEETWLLCPACRTRLHRVCAGCRAVVRLQWDLCPYCGEDSAAPAVAVLAVTQARSAS